MDQLLRNENGTMKWEGTAFLNRMAMSHGACYVGHEPVLGFETKLANGCSVRVR